jgi:hypothetical protein
MMNKAGPSVLPVLLEQLRLLNRDERVQRGDFVQDGCDGFEPWEGPSGFRADTFVKQIYRRVTPLKARKET